jgi:hypothetical protein
MKQDDDDTDQAISENKSEHPGESTLSCDFEGYDMDNQQVVLHLTPGRRDKTIRTSRVPPEKKWSSADNEIVRTCLQNLRHPARAIVPPLLQRQQSTINLLGKSDIVPAQALPLLKAGGDQNVPQPKVGGDYNVPQQQIANFKVAKEFMEAIVFSKSLCTIISDEK